MRCWALTLLILTCCAARSPLDLAPPARDASSADSSDHGIADANTIDAAPRDGGGDEGALQGPLRVFITSGEYAGNLGGLTGADDACQAEATAAGLSGSFMAWLSDSTDSPSTRFARNGGPYVRVDGVVIAHDWADLTDGAIDAPVNVTAAGQVLTLEWSSSANFSVWTATYPDGTPNTYCFDGCAYCDDWSSTSDTVLGSTADYRVINNSDSPGSWSCAGPELNCSIYTAHLFCFEQP